MTLAGMAWRSLRRQPARALLGVVGVAAVAALLLDMLLLAGGLASSFRELLDSTGYDVRVTATEALPGMGPELQGVRDLVSTVGDLDQVAQVAAIALATVPARRSLEDETVVALPVQGFLGTGQGTWQLLEGDDLPRDPGDAGSILVNQAAADQLALHPGDSILLGGVQLHGRWSAPPVPCTVRGIVEFPFQQAGAPSAVMSLASLEEVAGGPADCAAFLLVTSEPGAGDLAAVEAIRDLVPGLYAYSNAQYIQRFQAHDFAYFRQIAGVISTLALFFTFLLLTSLLTVSVNQRLGEVAGLRALGFRRRRVVAMLMWETLLSVTAGLLLAVVAGSIMAVVLDGILRDMPGLPDRLHFFVYRHEVLVQFLTLMVGTAALSLVYPAWIAARLPIAATLRKEVGT